MSNYYPATQTFEPVCSEEEEDRLFDRVFHRRRGWLQAREQLFRAYLLFALSLTKRIVGPFLGTLSGSMLAEEDFVAIANTGLMRAIERFDPKQRRSSFATYAMHFIRGHLYMHLRREVPKRLQTISLDQAQEQHKSSPRELKTEFYDESVRLDPWEALYNAEFLSYLQKEFFRCKITDEQKRFLLAMVKHKMNLGRVGKEFGYSRQRAFQIWNRLRAELRDSLMRRLPLEEQRQLAKFSY